MKNILDQLTGLDEKQLLEVSDASAVILSSFVQQRAGQLNRAYSRVTLFLGMGATGTSKVRLFRSSASSLISTLVLVHGAFR